MIGADVYRIWLNVCLTEVTTDFLESALRANVVLAATFWQSAHFHVIAILHDATRFVWELPSQAVHFQCPGGQTGFEALIWRALVLQRDRDPRTTSACSKCMQNYRRWTDCMRARYAAEKSVGSLRGEDHSSVPVKCARFGCALRTIFSLDRRFCTARIDQRTLTLIFQLYSASISCKRTSIPAFHLL